MFQAFKLPNEPTFPDYSVSIKDFGAEESGFSGDSINKAIAHVSEQGGGRNRDAWDIGMPCENVIIRKCRSLNQSRSGGIVVGSEMSAGVRNILAEDCDFAHNLNCIRIKSKDGRGGIVENMECRNIHMGKGMRGINLTYRYSCGGPASGEPEEKAKNMPVLKNLNFENITCDNADIGIAIDGIPDGKMENICMKDIKINAYQCMTSDSVTNLNMENVSLRQIEKV